MIPGFIRPTIKYPKQEVIDVEPGNGIVIGEIMNTVIPRRAVIPEKYLLQHTIILGSTGSGKTYTCSRIVARAGTYVRLVLDWHGEYGDLVDGVVINPYNYPVNPFTTDKYSAIEVLMDSVGISQPQAYILEKILPDSRETVSIEGVVARLETYIDESSWMRESRIALIRRLSPLTREGYRELFRSRGGNILSLVNTAKKPLILNLSAIRDPLVRRIYSALLLKKIFIHGINKGFKHKLLIVLEEAQNLLGRENPVGMIARMLAEIRKFGIGLVIVSQSPSSLLEDSMKNTNTKIIHSIKSSLDLEILSRILFLPPEYQRIIPYMDVGEAVLSTKTYKKPVIIRVS